MAYRDEGVIKIISIKYQGHRYYVQEMPGLCGCGRRYAVMCDRRRLSDSDYNDAKQAVGWLLAYMCRWLDRQTELQL